MDSRGKKAGKGPLVQENLSATLGVSQDQTLFVPRYSRGGGREKPIVSGTDKYMI